MNETKFAGPASCMRASETQWYMPVDIRIENRAILKTTFTVNTLLWLWPWINLSDLLFCLTYDGNITRVESAVEYKAILWSSTCSLRFWPHPQFFKRWLAWTEEQPPANKKSEITRNALDPPTTTRDINPFKHIMMHIHVRRLWITSEFSQILPNQLYTTPALRDHLPLAVKGVFSL